MKERLFMISIFTLLALAGVLIFGSALREDRNPNYRIDHKSQIMMINHESGVFERSHVALFDDNLVGQRTMSSYYNNRAYPGAPPTINHPVLEKEGIGGQSCLQCHQRGGYVSQFDAYAPITPHADWLSCRQCHVPINTQEAFKNSNWIKPDPPSLGKRAIMTGPQVIPHSIEGRENCLSCHAGPGAPLEIRVSHAERSNCRQCHVPSVISDYSFQANQKITGILFSRADSIYSDGSIGKEEIKGIEKWVQQ